MKDQLGNEFKKGQLVAYKHYHSIRFGKIVAFTSQKVRIVKNNLIAKYETDPLLHWTDLQFPDQVFVLQDPEVGNILKENAELKEFIEKRMEEWLNG